VSPTPSADATSPDPSSSGTPGSAATQATAPLRAAATILIVEDDDPLREILARHLRARGHRIHEAASAEAAGEALRAGLRPGLVLLDINLPGETGWSLVRGNALALAGDPPVIVASATTVDPRRLREHRVAGYLPKPFPLQTLLEAIERLTAPRPPIEVHE
jgi:DNA-binding response OmpR family regulator